MLKHLIALSEHARVRISMWIGLRADVWPFGRVGACEDRGFPMIGVYCPPIYPRFRRVERDVGNELNGFSGVTL